MNEGLTSWEQLNINQHNFSTVMVFFESQINILK